MELYSTLSSLFTVISFLVFLGIVAWAYGRRRQGMNGAKNTRHRGSHTYQALTRRPNAPG